MQQMKKLILLSVLVSQFAWAGCNIKTASRLANEHRVGNIENLIKHKGQDSCTVEFDIDVDGKTYHLKESEKGWEQVESLCYYARERARKNLLLDLGGEFKTEAITSCKEGDTPPTKLKIGDTILENEVGPSPIKKQFKYKGATCKMFQEHYTVDRKLETYNGVICQVDNSDTNWLIVDKW
jgi:hypothetical protein